MSAEPGLDSRRGSLRGPPPTICLTGDGGDIPFDEAAVDDADNSRFSDAHSESCAESSSDSEDDVVTDSRAVTRDSATALDMKALRVDEKEKEKEKEKDKGSPRSSHEHVVFHSEMISARQLPTLDECQTAAHVVAATDPTEADAAPPVHIPEGMWIPPGKTQPVHIPEGMWIPPGKTQPVPRLTPRATLAPARTASKKKRAHSLTVDSESLREIAGQYNDGAAGQQSASGGSGLGSGSVSGGVLAAGSFGASTEQGGPSEDDAKAGVVPMYTLKPATVHKFAGYADVFPSLCAVCDKTILSWGKNHIGVKCKVCGYAVHGACVVFAKPKCRETNVEGSRPNISGPINVQHTDSSVFDKTARVTPSSLLFIRKRLELEVSRLPAHGMYRSVLEIYVTWLIEKAEKLIKVNVVPIEDLQSVFQQTLKTYERNGVERVTEDSAYESIAEFRRALHDSKFYSELQVDITLLGARDVAEEITLIDSRLYNSITRDECVLVLWTKKDKAERAPNIMAFINRFNALTLYVMTECLKKPTPKERSLVIHHFIKIATYCRELRNFNALKAIIAGLQSTPVFRLKRTWALVSSKARASFDDYSALMSEDSNSAHFREALNDLAKLKAPVPCIPFLGVFLTDLVYVHTAFSNTPDVSHQKSEEVFDQIRSYRIPYSFTSVFALRDYLASVTYKGEDENYSISLEREPKEDKRAVGTENSIESDHEGTAVSTVTVTPSGVMPSIVSQAQLYLNADPLGSAPSNDGRQSILQPQQWQSVQQLSVAPTSETALTPSGSRRKHKQSQSLSITSRFGLSHSSSDLTQISGGGASSIASEMMKSFKFFSGGSKKKEDKAAADKTMTMTHHQSLSSISARGDDAHVTDVSPMLVSGEAEFVVHARSRSADWDGSGSVESLASLDGGTEAGLRDHNSASVHSIDTVGASTVSQQPRAQLSRKGAARDVLDCGNSSPPAKELKVASSRKSPFGRSGSEKMVRKQHAERMNDAREKLEGAVRAHERVAMEARRLASGAGDSEDMFKRLLDLLDEEGRRLRQALSATAESSLAEV